MAASSSLIRQRSSSFYDISSPSAIIDLELLDDKLIEARSMNWELEPGGIKNRLFWKDKKSQTEIRRRRVLLVIMLLLGIIIGWSLRRILNGWGEEEVLEVSKSTRISCDPYSLHGILLVNTTHPAANRFQPISAPKECDSIDYLTAMNHSNSKLYDSDTQQSESSFDTTKERGRANLVDLDFLRNSTVLVFGDSVDRDHVEHICTFLTGRLEMIHDKHPLSPPYPIGKETGPANYSNFWDHSRNWPNFGQSRPHICHLDSLNFRLVNVFHYGFRESEEFIENHPHFYPPALTNHRFDQIVIPLMENIARAYNVPSIPSLFSITPGFWGLLRMVTADDASNDIDAWSQIPLNRRIEIQERMEDTLHKVLNEKKWKRDPPRVLWRLLHHIKAHHTIPFNRLQSINAIGSRVVERAIEQSSSIRIGNRLSLDKWGAMMLGQQQHFRDDVHPLPLPGSWIYGQMLISKLKLMHEEKNL